MRYIYSYIQCTSQPPPASGPVLQYKVNENETLSFSGDREAESGSAWSGSESESAQTVTACLWI